MDFKSNKFNCLRLCITAALHPVTEHATRENKHIAKLVEDWEANEYVHNYITKFQNKTKINIWFYRPAQDGNMAKVERLEKCSDFVKERDSVRILV